MMPNPTYTFPEMCAHIVTGDVDTLPILLELIEDEAERYTSDEIGCMFGLLQFQYQLTTGALLKSLVNSILK